MKHTLSTLTMANLYDGAAVTVERAGPKAITVRVGGDYTSTSLHLIFMEPEALSGFLLAIAESPEAQQFLAEAGAGFHLYVQPFPQPVDVNA